LAAAKDMRLADMAQSATAAHVVLERIATQSAQIAAQVEAVEGLSLDDVDKDAAPNGNAEDAAVANGDFAQAAGAAAAAAARSPLAAASVASAVAAAQAALADAQAAKDAFLQTQQEGEFLARREAAAAQGVAADAAAALAVAKRTAAAVRKKGALGASASNGRLAGSLAGALAASRNKGDLLWAELADVAHNLVRACTRIRTHLHILVRLSSIMRTIFILFFLVSAPLLRFRFAFERWSFGKMPNAPNLGSPTIPRTP
jgi:hypothetical protein